MTSPASGPTRSTTPDTSDNSTNHSHSAGSGSQSTVKERRSAAATAASQQPAVTFYNPGSSSLADEPSTASSSYAGSPKFAMTSIDDADDPAPNAPYELPLYKKSPAASSAHLSSWPSFLRTLKQYKSQYYSSKNSNNNNNYYNTILGGATMSPAATKVLWGALATLLFLWIVLSDSYSRPSHIIHPTSAPVYTQDPFILPDLGTLSISGGPKLGKSAPNKAPGDYAPDTSDSNVPAAAKGSLKSEGATTAGPDGQQPPTPQQQHDANAIEAISSLIYKQESGALSSVWPFSFFAHDRKYPTVVLVLAINTDKYRGEYLEKILANRKRYAKKFGYGLYVRQVSDFKDKVYSHSLTQNPAWAKAAIMRAALHAFPDSQHFWYLDQSAVITDFERSVEARLIEPATLRAQMLKSVPVLKNFDVIKTYKNANPANIKLILTQDSYGATPLSFIFSNCQGDRMLFAKSMLDYWGDTAYVSYSSFIEKGDENALNHFLLWHPSYLSKTAIVPSHSLLAYSNLEGSVAVRDLKIVSNGKDENGNDIQTSIAAPITQEINDEYKFNAGDLAVALTKCETSSSFNCLQELSDYFKP